MARDEPAPGHCRADAPLTLARGFPSALYCPDCGLLAGVFVTQKGLWAPIPDGVLVWQCGGKAARKECQRGRLHYVTDAIASATITEIGQADARMPR